MMNYRDKTKSELITELLKLQNEYDSLLRKYSNDITENQLEKKVWHESEIIWHTLVKTIPDYIAIHDCEGNYLFLNHYADGFTEKEVLEKNFLDFISNESKEIFGQNFQKCLQTGITQVFEYEAFGDNNVIRSYESCLLPIKKKGKVVSIASIARDITEHKEYIKELHLHSEIMKNITEGFFLMKLPEEVILFTNSRFDEMFGYEHGEMIGKHVSVINAPTDKSPEETKQEIIVILKRTGEWHGEVLNIKKNGEHFWCYANVSVFDHPDYGKVSLSVHSDISVRKHAEEELKKALEWQQAIFEGSRDAIFISDRNSRFVAVNNAACDLTGYSRQKLLNMQIPDIHDTPDIKAYEMYHERIFNGEEILTEAKILRSDGTKIDTEFNNKIISIAGIAYMHTSARNITERVEAQETLRETSFYARNLIEASLDPLFTINADGKIMDVNNSTEDITGIKRAKLIGSDFSNYFTESDKASEWYRIVFKKSVVKDYPLTILHTDRTKIDFLFNASVYRNEEGEVQGVFAAARDITEHKKMEEELRKSKELLETLNQHLNDVRERERAVISREIHDELGQSMTALKLDLNHMYKYVKGIPGAALQLNNMIELVSDTIKDVQRISSDLRPGILDDLGLVSAIEWYCEEFEKRTGIICSQKLECPDNIDPRINLTCFRALQETLTNVIRHAKASSVKVKLHKTNKGITLIIHDNGIGIPAEKIESYKSLGLISMRERVRQLNGFINVSSETGHGTKVTIFMPVN
jgi:PAS domain S-box-containing protein